MNSRLFPRLQSRQDLAEFINVPLRHITYVLHGLGRGNAYKEIIIQKQSGAPRHLHAPSRKLLFLQQRVLQKMQPIWSPSHYAHGFSLDHSIVTNASLHQRAKVITKVDIQDFFPSIHFARVAGMFQAAPFFFGREAAVLLAQLACMEGDPGQLPQGGALSPYVANMICRRLDARLSSLARAQHQRYTRYADDITFSTNDLKRYSQVALISAIYEIIEDEGFAPNTDKTKILRPHERQIVTGIVVNDGLNVNRKYFRNLRALVRNCEKFGIDSQAMRKLELRDPRNSRPYIPLHAETDKDESALILVRHIMGRLSFLGQVVMANERLGQPENFREVCRRIIGYEQLLLRFYRLIEKDRRFSEVKKAAIRRLRARPLLWEAFISLDLERRKRREMCLADYRNSPQAESMLEQIRIASGEGLKDLAMDWAKRDPRFFNLDLSGESARKMEELARYPAISYQKTAEVLRSMKDSSDGLGLLVHSDTKFSGVVADRVLNALYYSRYYYIHQSLRSEFDSFVGFLDSVILDEGRDSYIDVLRHPVLSEKTREFKRNMRFGAQKDESTLLDDTCHAIVRSARGQYPRPGFLVEVELSNLSIYTHVPTIRDALGALVRSMLKNSKGSRLYIETRVMDRPRRSVELIVRDDSSENVAFDSSRAFVHGKIGKVIRGTNGLCRYFLESSSGEGGRRRCLDMHTGNVSRIKPLFISGVSHRLRFGML